MNAHYIRVLPGMTDLWQVSGFSRLSFRDRVRLDEQYLRNWSLWLNLGILARALWVVLRGEGAYGPLVALLIRKANLL